MTTTTRPEDREAWGAPGSQPHTTLTDLLLQAPGQAGSEQAAGLHAAGGSALSPQFFQHTLAGHSPRAKHPVGHQGHRGNYDMVLAPGHPLPMGPTEASVELHLQYGQ